MPIVTFKRPATFRLTADNKIVYVDETGTVHDNGYEKLIEIWDRPDNAKTRSVVAFNKELSRLTKELNAVHDMIVITLKAKYNIA